MRFLRLLALVCLCPLIMRNTAADECREADVVIIVDSPETFYDALDASVAPWMSFPCVDPEHFYLEPGNALEASEEGGERVNFTRRFIGEPSSMLSRPWEHHYEEREGELVRIEHGEGCRTRTESVRALALAVMDAVLEANAGNRVALTSFAGENDSRYSLNFTRDREKLLDMLYAFPECSVIDRSTALVKAQSYLARRSRSEIRTRGAYVILVTGALSDSGEYETRAYENALLLKKSASLGAITVACGDCGFVSALEGKGITLIHTGLADAETAKKEAETLIKSLGLDPKEKSQAHRPPIFRLAKARGREGRAR